jgi:proteic killer suppression protein
VKIKRSLFIFLIRTVQLQSLKVIGVSLITDRLGGIGELDTSNAVRYHLSVIKSFRNRQTENIFNGLGSRRFSVAIIKSAMRKLEILNAAEELNDLKVPPGNKLEALKGKRLGQHSIRINDQWRICFNLKNGDAQDVEIVDYH